MASRTRERLIDVARQLFVRQGIEKTTMNDIATASDRGRRTIYTYFRTKNDIFEAVVGSEVNRIISDLQQAMDNEVSATDRLRALINFRVNIARENLPEYEVWYKTLFSSNVKRAQAVRAMVTSRLNEIIRTILREGVASGEFDAVQASRAASVLTMMVRGADWTIVRRSEAEMSLYDQWQGECVDFIIDGLRLPSHIQTEQQFNNQ